MLWYPSLQTHENYPLVTGPGEGTPTKKASAQGCCGIACYECIIKSSMQLSWMCCQQVHTFSKDWALQADGYEPVNFDKPRCVS